MLSLTSADKEIIDSNYDELLRNVYSYLQMNCVNYGIEYSKAIISVFHSGNFSMTGKLIADNHYNYLYLPNLCSDGVLSIYGICSCRHATAFLYDVLEKYNFDISLMYYKVLNDGTWKRTSAINGNHVVLSLRENGKNYLVDNINKFIFELVDDDFKLISFSDYNLTCDVGKQNVKSIGKVLTKYYNLQKMGIDYIYDYDY